MGWVKLDDAYTHHPKVVAAGVQAMALDVGGMCYAAAHLTDGFIPDAAVPMLAPIRNANAAAAALVKVGRWERDDKRKGYVVHDYLIYNPAAEKVLAEREENRRRVEAHRKGGRKPVGNGVTPPVGNGVSTEAPSSSSSSNKSSSGEPLGSEPPDDDDRYRKLAEADLAQREAEKGQVGNREAWLVAATNRRRSAGNLEPPQARHATPPPAPPTVQPPDFVAAEGEADWDTGRAELERIKADREALRAGGTK